MAEVAIRLRSEACTIARWQAPQASRAVRRSPGLMKRTNSGDSRFRSVYVRSGFALVGQAREWRGGTCACRSASRYAGSSRPTELSMRTRASPPWQSAQPSTTPGFWCMVCRSVSRWQLMQPADFASASATLCRSGAGGARRSPESPSAGTMASVASRMRYRAFILESQQQVQERRIQRAALRVELLQALRGEERRQRRVEHHVLAHEGAPLHGGGEVPADGARGR